MRTLSGRTIEIAALVALILGRGRSALGTGGGRAAVWGEAASADKSFGVGVFPDGVTTGGVSPSVGAGVRGRGGIDVEGRDNADMKACLWLGRQGSLEDGDPR